MSSKNDSDGPSVPTTGDYAYGGKMLTLVRVVCVILVFCGLGIMIFGFPWGGFVALLACAAGAFSLLGSDSLKSAYWDLAQLHYSEVEQRRAWSLMAKRRSDFIDAFRPHDDDVHRALCHAAHVVRYACEDEVKLYRGFAQAQVSTPTDPEFAAAALSASFERRLADAKKAVKDSLAEFRRLRDLAKERGYDVHESWKPYAGLTEKSEASPRAVSVPEAGGVFAEDANEQPGG